MAGVTLATAATIAGGVAAVGGTIASARAQRSAQRAAEQRSKLEQQRQATAARRSRRQTIREAQIKRAQAIASAASAGALQSSGPVGGVGSISSQAGEAIGFSNVMSGLSRGITEANSNIMGAEARGQRASNIAGLGSNLFSFGAKRGGLDFFNQNSNEIPDFTGMR